MKTPLYAQIKFLRWLIGGAYVRTPEGWFGAPNWSPVKFVDSPTNTTFYFVGSSPTDTHTVDSSCVEEIQNFG